MTAKQVVRAIALFLALDVMLFSAAAGTAGFATRVVMLGYAFAHAVAAYLLLGLLR